MNEFKKVNKKAYKKPDKKINKRIDLGDLAVSLINIAERIKIDFPFESNALRKIVYDVKIEMDRLEMSLRNISNTIQINFPVEANSLLNIAERFMMK